MSRDHWVHPGCLGIEVQGLHMASSRQLAPLASVWRICSVVFRARRLGVRVSLNLMSLGIRLAGRRGRTRRVDLKPAPFAAHGRLEMLPGGSVAERRLLLMACPWGDED